MSCFSHPCVLDSGNPCRNDGVLICVDTYAIGERGRAKGFNKPNIDLQMVNDLEDEHLHYPLTERIVSPRYILCESVVHPQISS